jgi:cation diffusion facilitator CzcD-associated flavoprotein CzcO
VIIGAGFSGLCLGIRLKQAGIDTFTIIEKADRLGGTWRENVYPGAACDSPSFAYCFSFEPKRDWSRKWAEQPEILLYMEQCAKKYDLERHLRFSTELESAQFFPEEGVWRIRTRGGETITCDVLVSAVGQLNRPSLPRIAGIDSFQGKSFHSAEWPRDCDLSGKRVAVVGTAASAVQLVPRLAATTSLLYVLQRSANWMLPKNDRVYGRFERAVYRIFPFIARLYRWWLWLWFEIRFPVLRGVALFTRLATWMAEHHLQAQVQDAELRRILTPDYPIGAKRILISDDYYPALQKENVRLLTSGIERITPNGVLTRDGQQCEVDAIVYATGFQSTSFLTPMRIVGPGGRSLEQAWHAGAEAYLGITVAGFPNFFMMYGPNTNLGHNSIIFMIECQTRYILQCLKSLTRARAKSIELRSDVMTAYNVELQRELEQTVWAKIPASWYKTQSGRITNNWSGPTVAYWWRTRRMKLEDYELVPREAAYRERTARASAELET